jgi:DnaA family protein
MEALQLRARHRGLKLPPETASYLIKRSRRDMASLYELLDQLDMESLRAKRRLTIPFVRDVLESRKVDPDSD